MIQQALLCTPTPPQTIEGGVVLFSCFPEKGDFVGDIILEVEANKTYFCGFPLKHNFYQLFF